MTLSAAEKRERNRQYQRSYRKKVKKLKVDNPEAYRARRNVINRSKRVYARKQKESNPELALQRMIAILASFCNRGDGRKNHLKDIMNDPNLDEWKDVYRGHTSKYVADTVDLVIEYVTLCDKFDFLFVSEGFAEVTFVLNDEDKTVEFPEKFETYWIPSPHCFLLYGGKLYFKNWHNFTVPGDFGYELVNVRKRAFGMYCPDKPLSEKLLLYGTTIAQLKEKLSTTMGSN